MKVGFIVAMVFYSRRGFVPCAKHKRHSALRDWAPTGAVIKSTKFPCPRSSLTSLVVLLVNRFGRAVPRQPDRSFSTTRAESCA